MRRSNKQVLKISILAYLFNTSFSLHKDNEFHNKIRAFSFGHK